MSTDTTSDPLVVGVDPDESRRAALAWAADEALRRHRPLTLVHAYGRSLPSEPAGGGEGAQGRWREELRAMGEEVLKEALAFVQQRCPTVAASTVLAEGRPARVLADQLGRAELVVIGSRHQGTVRELFSADAVGLPLSARAACPIVVVREAEHATQEPPYFVVGVDGSPGSATALDFAFAEAELRGADLRTLCVWHTPLLGVLDEHAALLESRRVLDETLDGPAAAHPEVHAYREVVKGHPVQALAEASAHALGLIVGTRGHGGFPGMLLGSVSQGVMHHANCPVILIPRRSRPA